MKTLTPTRVFKPFDNVEIRLFGRNGGKTDWSIKTLEKSEDYQTDIYWQISRVAHDARVHWLLAPRPSEFNALICAEKDLTIAIRAPAIRDEDGTVEQRYVKILRGFNADGVEVPKYDAIRWGFWLSSADCLCVVALSPSGRLICTHAGTDCLWNRKSVLDGAPHLRHASVIGTIAEKLGGEMSGSRFFLACGISPEHLTYPHNHEKHGWVNERMYRHLTANYGNNSFSENPRDGKLNLKQLVRNQLECFLVPSANIFEDNVDTFGDTASDGQPLWWSNRRGDGDKRNGVMVIHH